MGDIADMVLEGCLCQSCGEYLGDGEGYATYCASCAAEQGIAPHREDLPNLEAPKTPCPVCGRKIVGVQDHMRDKHGVSNER